MTLRLAFVMLTCLLASGCLSASTPAPGPAPLAFPHALTCDPCKAAIPLEGEATNPSLATDPDDANHSILAVTHGETGFDGTPHEWIVSLVTTDAGRSWTPVRVPGGPAAGLQDPLAFATDLTQGVVAALPGNVVLIAGLATSKTPTGTPTTQSSGSSLFVARSSDRGKTFPDVQVLASGRGTEPFLPLAGTIPFAWRTEGRPSIAAGPNGQVLLAWTDFQLPPLDSPADLARGDLVFSASGDAGKTWSQPKPVASKATTAYEGPSAGISNDGTWYVAYAQAASDPSAARPVFLGTSQDQGKTWKSSQVSEGALEMPSLKIVAASQGANRLFLAYVRNGPEGNELVVSRSRDGGASWEAPLRLDAVKDGAGAVLPCVTSTNDGVAYVGFHHVQGDNSTHRIAQIWGDAIKTVDIGTNASRSQDSQNRSSIAADGTRVLAAWMFDESDSTPTQVAWARVSG